MLYEEDCHPEGAEDLPVAMLLVAQTSAVSGPSHNKQRPLCPASSHHGRQVYSSKCQLETSVKLPKNVSKYCGLDYLGRYLSRTMK